MYGTSIAYIAEIQSNRFAAQDIQITTERPEGVKAESV